MGHVSLLQQGAGENVRMREMVVAAGNEMMVTMATF